MQLRIRAQVRKVGAAWAPITVVGSTLCGRPLAYPTDYARGLVRLAGLQRILSSDTPGAFVTPSILCVATCTTTPAPIAGRVLCRIRGIVSQECPRRARSTVIGTGAPLLRFVCAPGTNVARGLSAFRLKRSR